jgi:FdhE protein
MPNPPDQELETALEAYLAALPRQARLIRLAGEVLRQVAAVQADLPSAPAMADSEAEARLHAGELLLAHLPFSTPTFRQTLSRLLELCRQFELLPPLPPDVLQALLSLPPPAWLADNLGLADICQDREVSVGLVLFLGQKALSPYYQRAVAPYAPLFLQGSWQQGNCPNCGQKPALASLAPESGQKLLYCSLCAIQWPFSRRACVFCGQEEPHFAYLFVEEDPARRADLCQACQGYLKTIVTGRLTHPLCLPLEEFVTVDLDILMARDDLLS